MKAGSVQGLWCVKRKVWRRDLCAGGAKHGMSEMHSRHSAHGDLRSV